MNREIKFRVWDNFNEQFLKSDTANLNFLYNGQWLPVSKFIGSESYTIQQFTGLKDKNGKEIYEGDMVNLTKRGITHGPDAEDVKNAEVWYSLEDCAFVFGKYKSADYTWWYSMADVLYDFEVVGNIFENPNLLDNTSKI